MYNCYIFRIFLALSAVGLLGGCGAEAEAVVPPADSGETLRLSVGAPLARPDTDHAVPRYGINLGGPSAWGAEQLLANVVANPGFEPVLDRSLVTVTETRHPQQWARNIDWNSRLAGFWRDARGDVLTGRHAGASFRVRADNPAAGADLALVQTDPPLPLLQNQDVVSLQTESDPLVPARWWGQGRISTVPGASAGSGGQRVARLEPAAGTTTALSSYMDTLERAGRLLPVNGAWELRFAARANGAAPARLRVRVAREGGEVFIDRSLALGADWSAVRLSFKGSEPTHGRGTLSLSFSLEHGSVDLDDVFLGESSPGAGGFRQVVVDTLRQLRPGYLREWQGQLGDTTTNRLAADSARRPVRYRPGEAEVLHTYNLSQTFALCQAVGARPWLVLPTTLGADEAYQYGKAVRALATEHGLDEVLVEFGNENWNPLFAAAGFVSATAHTTAAQRALSALREGYGPRRPGEPRLVTSVNARMGDAAAVSSLARLTVSDRVSVAPYFAYRMDASATLADQWAHLMNETDGKDVQAVAEAARGKLSAYEINLHTTEGNAPADQRNAWVSGAHSGPALARRLLQGSLAGLREQAVYALAGFDAFASNGEPVRLFGVTRDLAEAGRFRPTGWALGMLNAVAGGKAYAAHCKGQACPEITAVAFVSDQQGWAIVNSGSSTRTLHVDQACQTSPLRAQLLNGQNPWLNNETAPMVAPMPHTGRCEGTGLLIDVPPRSLLVLG